MGFIGSNPFTFLSLKMYVEPFGLLEDNPTEVHKIKVWPTMQLPVTKKP